MLAGWQDLFSYIFLGEGVNNFSSRQTKDWRKKKSKKGSLQDLDNGLIINYGIAFTYIWTKFSGQKQRQYEII